MPTRGFGIAEELGIGPLISDIHTAAVQRHDTQTVVPGARRALYGQRTQYAVSQHLHDLRAQARTRLGYPRFARLHCTRLAAAEPLQALAHHPQHLLQRRLAPQRQRHHVVHHCGRRQQPFALAGLARLGQHLFDQRARTDRRQHPGADQVRHVNPGRKCLACSCHRCRLEWRRKRIVPVNNLSEQYCD